MKRKTVHIKGCDFEWSVDAPYCIIWCLQGKERELIHVTGTMCMTLGQFTPKDEDKVVKMLFTEEITMEDFDYACSVCLKKGISDIAYFFGILKNLKDHNKIKNTAKYETENEAKE